MMMILDGMKAIRGFLGDCGKQRVRALVAAGAPIRVTGKGDGRRYIADSERLLAWIGNQPAPSGT